MATHWYGDRISEQNQEAKSFLGKASFGNQDFATVEAKIRAIPSYKRMFAKAFPGKKDPVTQQNCGKAIGPFERPAVTFSSFDGYRKGDIVDVSASAKAGLAEFLVRAALPATMGSV